MRTRSGRRSPKWAEAVTRNITASAHRRAMTQLVRKERTPSAPSARNSRKDPARTMKGTMRVKMPRRTSAILNGLAAPSHLGRRHAEHARERAAHVRRVGESRGVRRLAERRTRRERRTRALELQPPQVGADRDPHGLSERMHEAPR